MIANAMVYGDNKLYNVALVVADTQAVTSWAAENGLSGKDVEALLKDTKVKERFKDEIAKFGEHFKGFEEIKDFALISEDFTQENGMLTPSMKVKRREVLKKWGPLIEGLYVPKKSSTASPN
jgi:long-chain acyl-CoA synthetase